MCYCDNCNFARCYNEDYDKMFCEYADDYLDPPEFCDWYEPFEED